MQLYSVEDVDADLEVKKKADQSLGVGSVSKSSGSSGKGGIL